MPELRDLLFADQSLETLLAGLPRADRWRSAASAANPWPLLFAARELEAEGRRDEAIDALRLVADLPGAETRVHLWAWRALRGLGVRPEPPASAEVLGVVIELPLQIGVDTLAAYRDGSARYVNQGGAVLFFEGGEPRGARQVARLLDAAQHVVDSMPLAQRRPVPRTRVRYSLLSRQGIRAAESPLARAGHGDTHLCQMFRAATDLMSCLLRNSNPLP